MNIITHHQYEIIIGTQRSKAVFAFVKYFDIISIHFATIQFLKYISKLDKKYYKNAILP